jgi:hypothetical protein
MSRYQSRKKCGIQGGHQFNLGRRLSFSCHSSSSLLADYLAIRVFPVVNAIAGPVTQVAAAAVQNKRDKSEADIVI